MWQPFEQYSGGQCHLSTLGNWERNEQQNVGHGSCYTWGLECCVEKEGSPEGSVLVLQMSNSTEPYCNFLMGVCEP